MEQNTNINQPENNQGDGTQPKTGEKTFTQDDVNRIVSERLAKERAKSEQPKDDAREKALTQREARMDCREYLAENSYPSELIDILDSTDAEKFKTAVKALSERFPSVFTPSPVPPPYAAGTGTKAPSGGDPIANAFKPKI